jgi:hypothetical protein
LESAKQGSILVEYQKNFEEKHLGIITGKSNGKNFEVLNSKGKIEEIGQNEVTYQWASSKDDLNSQQIPKIQIKCENLTNQIPIEQVELFWRKQINNRKSASFKVQDASLFFFESENGKILFLKFLQNMKSLHLTKF